MERNTVWLCLFMTPVILWIGNYLIYQKWLSLAKMIAVFIPIALYFLIGRQLLLAMFVNPRRRLIKLFMVMLVVLGTVFPVCYFLVYLIYPEMGIVLYNEEVAYSHAKFVKHLLSSFTGVLFLSLCSVTVTVVRKIRRQSESALHKARLSVEDMKYRLQLRKINPHFVSAIMNTAMGRSIMGKGKDSKDMLIRLNQVMAYVLTQDEEEHPAIRLSVEWRCILDLVAVLRWKYGHDKVQVTVKGTVDDSLMVVSMSMLTLLENAVRYTDFGREQALQITLCFDDGGFSFLCRNGYDAQQRRDRQNTRFGLQNLRERLACSSLALQLSVEDMDGYFVVKLNNNDNDGKYNVHRSDSR